MLHSNTYVPDNWVIIKVTGDDPHYKVLAGWSGGYTQGTSWRMNSGITDHNLEGDHWYFYGSSGSVYKCHVDSYGLKMNNVYVWNALKERHGDIVSLLDDQEWVKDDWIWV